MSKVGQDPTNERFACRVLQKESLRCQTSVSTFDKRDDRQQACRDTIQLYKECLNALAELKTVERNIMFFKGTPMQRKYVEQRERILDKQEEFH